jgi:hypothetical protein
METIKRKLAAKERAEKVKFFVGVLNRLAREKQRPQKSDTITNPLSEFKTVAQKRAAYNNALDAGADAWIDFDKTIKLGAPGAEFKDVEFIGGLWRVQRPFNRKITRVRDRDFTLGEKLPHQEHTNFDFFKAYMVTTNCYGRFIFENKDGYDNIVARYETKRGTFWAYGKTIADARAFLAISIYDSYQDLIDLDNAQSRTK